MFMVQADDLCDENQILGMRKIYTDTIEKMGIRNRINANNRFFQAFNLIEEWHRVVVQRGDLADFLERRSPDKTLHFALQETTEMIRALQYLDPNDSLAKEKLILASSGVLHPRDETDTVARNTQFELSLYSSLRRSGYDARLCDPNPDIQVSCNDVFYNIECKRAFSPTQIDRNFSKAAKQLRLLLAQSPDNHYGIVALSVLSSITERIAHIDATSMDVANAAIGHGFLDLVNKHSRTWTKSSRLMGDRIPGVMLHMLITVMDQSLSPPERHLVNNYAFTNTGENQQSYKELLENLSALRG